MNCGKTAMVKMYAFGFRRFVTAPRRNVVIAVAVALASGAAAFPWRAIDHPIQAMYAAPTPGTALTAAGMPRSTPATPSVAMTTCTIPPAAIPPIAAKPPRRPPLAAIGGVRTEEHTPELQ